MNENNNISNEEHNNSFDFINNDDGINENQKQISSKSGVEQKPIKKKNSHAFQYISYLSIIISIYIFFFINYLKTNKWYDENIHYISLRPLSICDNYIKNFEDCIEKSQKTTSKTKRDGDKYIYDTNIICKEDNDKLQGCFDNVQEFTRKCQLYLNELSICKNKNGKEKNDCLKHDLINCWKAFNLINITKVFDYL